jgi:hypothetical protein
MLHSETFYTIGVPMKFYTFIAALFLVACTPVADDTSESPKSEPTSEPASSPTSSPTSETDCTDAGSFDLCAQCLAEENPTGAQAYSLAIVDNCYCANDCAESCADFCADTSGATPPSADCDSCVNTVGADQSSACIEGFSAECGADASCLDFANALQSCPQ